MQNIVTDGIILKRKNYAEADRILDIYTNNLGKISAIAKGSRKLTSKKSGHLELGNVVQFDLIPGKNMFIIAGAKIKDRHQFIDLKQMKALFLWLEIVDTLIHHNEPCNQTFDLACKGLIAASQINDRPMQSALVELKLYDLLGYRMNLNECLIGGESLVEGRQCFLSMHKGGLVCELHKDEDASIKASVNIIKILRLVHFGNWDILDRLHACADVINELREIVEGQRHYIVGKKLKSEM